MFLAVALLGKKSYYHQSPILFKTSPIDKVEKLQRQKIASFIGHVFQLTYAALIDKLI